MAASELVVVYDAPQEVLAILYRSMLVEAGIAVVEQLWESDALEGVQLRALHSQLLVSAADAVRARALVEAFTAEASSGELALDALTAERAADVE